MRILVCLAATGSQVAGQVDTLVVLHTNDFHGYISEDGDRAAGAARIAAFFKQVRSERRLVISLDAGDCVSGTPVSVLFKGKPIYEVLEQVGYDAIVLGNHEFDYGWKAILAYRDLVSFPLLSANALSPDGGSDC
jgi:2',3'-cyclic-nucleotide 2'-phosphodiesterase (5'-nucleotidase family)